MTRRAPMLFSSLLLVGLVLIYAAGMSIRSRETEILGGGQSYLGVTLREPISSGAIRAQQDPVLFWIVVVTQLGIGVPLAVWSGFRLIRD